MDTQAYRAEHRRILQHVSELLSLSQDIRTRGDAIQARGVMDRLDAVLKAHLEREDGELYAQLQRSDDAEVRATADRAVEDMGGLRDAWASFLARSQIDVMLADRPRFAAACTALMEALAFRVRWEDDTLYALVDGVCDRPGG